MNHTTQPLSCADINIFSSQINKFCYTRNTDTDFISRQFPNLFFESLKAVLISMITTLMILAKIATPGFLKIKSTLK